ncbi:MAG: NBR1-Ig-like domain-containing protein [Anaerolineales bacterium]|jgi:hypothetical protein
MKINSRPFRISVIKLGWLIFLLGALSACTNGLALPQPPQATPAAPYLPPTRAIPSPTPLPPPTSTPAERLPLAPPPCIDQLTFIDDLTIPDGSVVSPGQALDKRWQVENSGACNWDERYRLRLIAGSSLGSPSEQALYPARSGAVVDIQILFTAPEEAGAYRSAWQAYGPTGEPFGDQIFIDIVVAGP